jgi:hypothetical protein
MMGAMIGTIGGVIAALAARDRYERHYGDGPYYAPARAPYGYYRAGPYRRY